MIDPADIYLILFTLLLSGFFSGIEIAYFSANRLKLELKRKQSPFLNRLLGVFTDSPARFLGTTLIGNNITLVLLSIFIARVLEPIIIQWVEGDFSIMLIQTLVCTVIVLIFGEFLPKTLFRLRPENILTHLALPLAMVYYLLYPIVQLTTWLSRGLLKLLFNQSSEEQKPVFNRVDLEHFINQFYNNQEDEEEINKLIFEKALYLNTIKVRECMIPRTEIEALDIEDSIETLKEKFVQTRLSRLIVYKDSIDDIVGYVHHFDLLKNPSHIRDILFEIEVVPESMPARDLLNIFSKKSRGMAWVVDEFGGTAGIITLEDILEEIFGEINDEHDDDQFIEHQISEHEFIFSGRLEIDYLNEKYNLQIPEGDYETLSGYIISQHESIPEAGEEIHTDTFIWSMIRVSDKKIDTVKLVRNPNASS